MTLTPEAVKRIVRGQPPDKRREVPAGDGLYLIHQPSGVASWAYRFRNPLDPERKVKKLTLGTVLIERNGKALDGLRLDDPKTLTEARKAAKAASVDVDHGKDPAAEKRARKAPKTTGSVGAPDTVRALSGEFIEHCKGHRKRWDEVERQFNVEINPKLGDRRVTALTKADVREFLQAIRDRLTKQGRKGVTANRVKATLSAFLTWLADEKGIEDLAPIRVKVLKEHKRDRLLSDDEIRLFWQATGELEYPFGPLHRLLLLTGQRRGEIAGVRRSELTFGDKPWWLIPAARVKNGNEHLVPLVPAVIAILNQLEPHVMAGLYFTTNGGRTAVSGFSNAKERIDAKMLTLMQKAAEECGDDPSKVALEPFTVHDLRATMYSGLSALGYRRELVEKIVNHKPRSADRMAAVYDRYAYADEKREALQAWANRLMGILAEQGVT